LKSKLSLRKQVAEARDSLSLKARESKSSEIEERLFLLREFKSAAAIMFFASFRSEVETLPMIRHSLAVGKRIILPKVNGEDLRLFEIHDVDKDLSQGTWGIPEPREIYPVTILDVDFMIVPGVAFDLNGNRLGYGAGYYDRILPLYKKETVALAFEIQIVPEVPISALDIPVKKIVTEKRTIVINKF